MSAVANALGVSRQHVLLARRMAAARRRARPPLPEEERRGRPTLKDRQDQQAG